MSCKGCIWEDPDYYNDVCMNCSRKTRKDFYEREAEEEGDGE